jgi:phospholipase C
MRKIEHVVVLMLENRSFDSTLGRLYPKSERFDGLDGTESNPWHKQDGTEEQIRVWNSAQMGEEAACIPDPDPGELFEDMSLQIFGLGRVPGARPSMTGFVDSYMRQPADAVPTDPRAVMHYFTPAQVPVISELAKAFGVCDRWHASAPCETWPNRFFAHTGTAGGFVNNRRSRFPYRWPRPMPTIFRRLDAGGHNWRIYFHDVPQAATLIDLWAKIPTRFCLFDPEFAQHSRSGRLASYSFIEPRYYPNRWLRKVPNDQHPPHNMLYGEQLIAATYNALRSAPTWNRTLLIVTYDEHGGCFDHMPPPAAVPPGGAYPDGFTFDRYGVRVPAVIISPYVVPGSIIRPPPRGDGTPYGPFEHASIIATLQSIFDLGPPLTSRVAAVPNLLGALALEQPENSGPTQLSVHPQRPSSAEAWAYARRRRNGLQHSLRDPLSGLPGAMARVIAHARRLGSIRDGWRRRD